MIKVLQTKLHKPEEGQRGNCFAAVIASFLCCSIKDVPRFEDTMHDTEIWPQNAVQWLAERGWNWGSLKGHLYGDQFYLVVGKSPRGVNHVCIYRNGKLWHDPHPSQAGLITEVHFEYLDRDDLEEIVNAVLIRDEQGAELLRVQIKPDYRYYLFDEEVDGQDLIELLKRIRHIKNQN